MSTMSSGTGWAWITGGTNATDQVAIGFQHASAHLNINLGGVVYQLDQQATGGASPVVFTEFTKDLGAARRSGTFDLTGLTGLTAGKPVLAWQSMAAITSKGDARDEAEMDRIEISGYVVDANTIRLNWSAPSVVVGTYAFAYQIGA